MVVRDEVRQTTAEQQLKALGIELPAPPEPFGTYVEAAQSESLLFLSDMLPTEGRGAKVIGRVGAELDVEAGRAAARFAALNALAVAKEYLGSLDKVTRIVRLGVSVATSGNVAISRKLPTPPRIAAGRLWKSQESVPTGLRSREPAAWHTGGVGGNFRGDEVRRRTPRMFPSSRGSEICRLGYGGSFWPGRDV